MKTINSDEWRVASDERNPGANVLRSAPGSREPLVGTALNPQPSTFNRLRAFTLIELLVVMAIIGALAALLLAVAGPVKTKQKILNTRAEMDQLITAIENYKATYGFYPPSPAVPPAVGNPLTLPNQLYYELAGTVFTNGSYTTLDGNPPSLTPLQIQGAFGVGGFLNCTKGAGGEDATAAHNFLPELRPKQYYLFTNINTGPQGVNLLVASVGGPDQTYQPVGLPDVNPWRYNSSNPTNNPGGYDLWVQLVIGGKTNLICNWSKQAQLNSPMP